MFVLVLLFLCSAHASEIPRAWEKQAIESLQIPLAERQYSSVHIAEDAYYRIPERVIYKSYPVYAPGRAPAGYDSKLKGLEPKVEFDPTLLKTDADWIAAGEVVFNAPTSLGPVFFSERNLKDPNFFHQTGMPVAKDGTIPFARWVIRQKGKLELGSMGCATCHTRVLDDGTVLPGAQGNNPGDRQGALLLRESERMLGAEATLKRVRGFASQFEVPWRTGETPSLTLAQMIAAGEAIPPGVTARANTSMILPPQIPDLIGVKDRRYLDHTGIIRQRSIGDLMRYSSLSQDLFVADRYGASHAGTPRTPGARYSDAQLYALASYLYSLRPPVNPNSFDAAAQRGKAVFENQKCGRCHPAPLYTNNKLAPVDGFTPPPELQDVMATRLGLDPRYALESPKATGFYKVPSLKGVWYRGPFGHNGSAATLEDWLDPRRLEKDYTPTGFKGFDGNTRGIPGHRFGLTLAPNARRDLISFLKTL